MHRIQSSLVIIRLKKFFFAINYFEGESIAATCVFGFQFMSNQIIRNIFPVKK